MRMSILAPIAGLTVAVVALAGAGQSEKIDRAQLRKMLVDLGYEVKDLDSTAGKEKFSFVIQRSGLNIPISAEISPSETFVWLTVLVKDGLPKPENTLTLLRDNAQIQPTQIYVTKLDKTMLGLPVENRDINNALLRQRAEKIAEDVVKTRDHWQ